MEAEGEYSYVKLESVPDTWDAEADTATDLEVPTESDSLLAAGYYDIVSTWSDLRSRAMVLRQGPWDKIRVKHGLTISTVQKVTQREDRTFEAGTTWKYETIARLYTCRTFPWPECEVTDEQLVRVIDQTRLLSDQKKYGVVTAYCPPLQGLCPAWVNNSL